MKILLTTLLFGLMISGCCTSHVNEQIRECSAPVNELVPRFEHDAKIYTGLYVGIEEKNKKLYHHYIFKNILINQPNRILQVLIPFDREDIAEINEIASKKKFDDTETAYLFSQYYGFTFKYSLNGGIRDTRNYFNTYYPEVNHKYSSHMINLWIRPEQEKSVVNQIRKNEGGPGYCWYSYDSKMNIKWCARNKTNIRLQKLKYLYSVPVDIITFPFQLVAFLVVANGNSCF